jgi:organic radical activating enzyme
MGKRQLNRCAIVAVKHCNLSCAGCNHLSPLFKEEFIEPIRYKQSVTILAKHVEFNTLVLQGGEPLLHPKIDELIRISIGSGLARKVHVLTNGTFLHKMTDQFWDEVDRVELSAYPGVKVQEIPPERMKKVKLSYLGTFNESFSTQHTWDADLVQKIKNKCNIFGRYCALSRNYFYKCVISSFIPSQVKHQVLTSETVDGIMLEENDEFEGKLLGYLDDKRPLKSCEFCTGTSGRSFPHTQANKMDWLSRHDRPVGEMIRRL